MKIEPKLKLKSFKDLLDLKNVDPTTHSKLEGFDKILFKPQTRNSEEPDKIEKKDVLLSKRVDPMISSFLEKFITDGGNKKLKTSEKQQDQIKEGTQMNFILSMPESTRNHKKTMSVAEEPQCGYNISDNN